MIAATRAGRTALPGLRPHLLRAQLRHRPAADRPAAAGRRPMPTWSPPATTPMAQANPAGAMVSYRQALAINDNDPALWLKLAAATLARADAEAAAPATAAYDLGVDRDLCGAQRLPAVRGRRRAGRRRSARSAHGARTPARCGAKSIATYRAAWRWSTMPKLQAALDKAGRRARLPHRLATRSMPKPPRRASASCSPIRCRSAAPTSPSYVVVEDAPQVAVETEQSQICIDGVEHGSRYHVHAARRPALGRRRDAAQRRRAQRLCARPRAVRRLCQQCLCDARRARRRPADHLGQCRRRRCRRSTGSATARSPPRCATASSSGTLDGYSAEDIANQYGEKVWEGRSTSPRASPTP